MFRVPVDPENPSLSDTFKVGLFRWLTSHHRERKEWTRRRNAALDKKLLARLQGIDSAQEQRTADFHRARADWREERLKKKQQRTSSGISAQ